MRIESAFFGMRFLCSPGEIHQVETLQARRLSYVVPDLLRRMTNIATPLGQLCRKASGLLADPTDCALIPGDRLGLCDLDTPAAVLFPPKLGDDAEPDKRVVHVLSQSFRSHRELDPRVSAHRIDGPIAAHQNLDELQQPIAIPLPHTRREPLLISQL